MHDEVRFGSWIKSRRKALGLTQHELAQRIGCAVITLQKIEARDRRPSTQIAERMATALGIPDDRRSAFVQLARTPTSPEAAPFAQAARSLLSSLSPGPLTNLSPLPVPLVGRSSDVTAARKLLLNGNHRLLTFVGPPGVGKTSLAVQLATELRAHFADGVFFVPLALTTDAGTVPQTICRTLGLNPSRGQTEAGCLRDYLRDKEMLLVLDNFEQVVAAAPFVSELSERCPWVSLVVTSRAALRIHRERRVPVLPLALPTSEGIDLEPAELLEYPAIALFVDRAQAVQPDFALTAGNAAAVAHICIRLGGLPLAIELIAARCHVLAPEQLLERLTGRMVLQSGGLRDLPGRHRTLRDAIDQSYALLSPEEQLLFCRLSAFEGGWTIEAAESVAREPMPLTSVTVLDTLSALADSSLIQRQGQGSEIRFSQLELIREYALERLPSSDAHTTRRRHAEYYLRLAQEADACLRGADQNLWIERLESDGRNFRAAFTWFTQGSEDIDQALRLCGALWWFWQMRGHLSEGSNWLTTVLARSDHAPPELVASAYNGAGTLAWYQGDLTRSRGLLDTSVGLYRTLDPVPQWELALALTTSAMVAVYQTEYALVETVTAEALELFHRLNDRWGIALALLPAAKIDLGNHNYAAARTRLEESLLLFRATGDRWGMGTALLNLGTLELVQGHYEAARRELERSIALHREVGECWMRSLTLDALGGLLHRDGAYAEAASLYGESLELLRRIGLAPRIADILYNFGCVVESQGDLLRATRLYRESLDLFTQQENVQGQDRCRSKLAALSFS